MQDIAPRLSALPLRTHLRSAMLMLACFPYIIVVVPSADNQPIFLAAGLLWLLVEPRKSAYRVLSIITIIICALPLFFWPEQNFKLVGNISMAQFAVAISWGWTYRKNPNHSALIIYVVTFYLFFTIVHLLSGGIVEAWLMASRDTYFNVASGRGASTLSPEQSFFALQIFYVYIFSRLVSIELGAVTFAVILFLLVISGSFYGLVATSALVYDRWKFKGAVVAGGAVAIAAMQLDVRLASLLKLAVSSTSVIEFISSDVSASRRFAVFISNLSSEGVLFPFGVGFGSNAISGLSGLFPVFGILGIVGLTFCCVIVAMFSSHRLLFGVWFLFVFVSGSVTLPFVGILLAMFFRESLLRVQEGFDTHSGSQRRRLY